MRGLAIIEHKRRKRTDPPTTQHVHSLDAALLHMAKYGEINIFIRMTCPMGETGKMIVL